VKISFLQHYKKIGLFLGVIRDLESSTVLWI